ncbi:MAG: hypothetical protein K0U37_09115 [Gammaproteobacteria bacterium]|nr:hypothetical protein [Gammaproteobacteria bacterium]
MKLWACLLSLFLSFPAFAIAIDIPPGQWQCMAVDQKEQNYGGLGKSMNAARRAAKAECRRRSNAPRSCQTAQSYCEQGPVSLVEDRCIVSDGTGRTWNTTGKDSCRTARSLCQQWQYLHGSTRSACTVKHRMRNYDSGDKNKDKDETILEKLINTDD